MASFCSTASAWDVCAVAVPAPTNTHAAAISAPSGREYRTQALPWERLSMESCVRIATFSVVCRSRNRPRLCGSCHHQWSEREPGTELNPARAEGRAGQLAEVRVGQGTGVVVERCRRVDGVPLVGVERVVELDAELQ